MSAKLSARFEQFSEEEYLEFDRIENPRSKRADLHAFLVMAEADPGDEDVVCHAEHDQIWLSFNPKKIAKLSDDVIGDLVRCGVRYDDGDDGFKMLAFRN